VAQPAELELLGASAPLVSGLLSVLPLFSAACVSACYTLLHVMIMITAAKGRINYVVMRTFASALPTIPVLLFFVLVL